MTSHYLRYANLAANLQLAFLEEGSGSTDLPLPHCSSKILGKSYIKTTQDSVNLLEKLDALEARDDYKKLK